MSAAAAAPASRRRLVLGFAALATLAASVWALGDDTPAPAVAVAARPAARADAARPAAAEMPPLLALPEREAPAAYRRNLFAASPVLQPPAAPVAASAPVAPPRPPITLPFTFGGRMVNAAGSSVLLNEGSQTHVLAAGATQGDFRLEQDNGAQLEFTHVPTGERLVLPIQP